MNKQQQYNVIYYYRKEKVRAEQENYQLRHQMVEYQQELERYDRKLKELESELRLKVDWLTQQLEALPQSKKKSKTKKTCMSMTTN